MNWVFFALLGPLSWSVSSFVDKYILGKYTKGIFDFVFFSTISSWFFFLALLVFVGMPNWNAFSLIPLATGVILAYSYAFYAKALEQGDTSTLTVLFKLIPVLTVMLAYVFLGQVLSVNELIGFIVVFVGAIVVSIEKKKSIFTRGFGMILVAIVMWSGMALMADYGLTKISFWDYILIDTLGSALAGLPLFLISSIRKQVVHGLRTATIEKYVWFNVTNLLDFLGQMSIKKSLALAPSAGLVTVVMQIQSFYSIAIGVLLTLFIPNIIREDITRPTLIKKLIGAIIMFSGVYILLR